MAYTTGTVLSLSECYDALISFMTANGWSLYDNIPISGSRDKILYSGGTDGKLNMYYRISSNVIGNPFKDPGDAHIKFPYIFVRGYHNWNATSHSGSGEYGVWGPMIWAGQQYSNSAQHVLYRFERGDGTLASPLNPTSYAYTFTSNGCAVSHDGRRKMWSGNANGVQYFDVTSPESRTFTAGAGNTQPNGVALVKDPTTDREYAFVMDAGNSNFYRFDVDSQTFSNVAPPPWGLVSSGTSFMLWDGADFIYVMRGTATTSWAKYSISGNNWTSLAVTPVAAPAHSEGASTSNQRMVYVPNSVTGIGEDVIYAAIADTGTVIYRYDVTSNVWRTTAGTGALTSPFTWTSTSKYIFWDRQRYLYVWDSAIITNLSAWRSDLTTAPNTFSSLGVIDNAGRNFAGGASIINQITSKLRCSNVIPGKYFFHGDANSIRMIFRVGSNAGVGRYYWSYLGKYDTAYRPQIMGVTQAVSPGVRVTVNVDSTSGFTDGQGVLIANWSGSHFERANIYQISGSTAFLCNVTSSFPSGTKVGVDPSQIMLAGDTHIGIAPIDSGGYETDLEPAYYTIRSLQSVISMAKHAPSTRDAYMPVPLSIYNDHDLYGGVSTGVTAKYETLGTLKSVFTLLQTDFPGPQNEDILVFGSEQYIYFNVQECAINSTDTRGIVVGPI